MTTIHRTVGRTVLILAALAAFGATGFAQAALAPSVDGTISAISGTLVTLTLADGTSRSVTLQGSTMVLARQVATLDAITAGDAVGVAARRDNNALVATNINIFAPRMWDIVRKGQFPMADGQTMTNAVVAQSVKGVRGRTLTMKLTEGITSISVPDEVPIHRLVALTTSSLAVGLHVVIRGSATADGTFTAASVSFDQSPKG